MHMDASVGKQIKHWREEKKITQHELARLLGITPAAVCQWETKGTVPRAKTLAKVAEALGVSKDDFSETESSASWSIEAYFSVSEYIEKLKAKVAEATGVETNRVSVNITIADSAPSAPSGLSSTDDRGEI